MTLDISVAGFLRLLMSFVVGVTAWFLILFMQEIVRNEYGKWAPALARCLVRMASTLHPRRRAEWTADITYLQTDQHEVGLWEAARYLAGAPILTLRGAVRAAFPFLGQSAHVRAIQLVLFDDDQLFKTQVGFRLHNATDETQGFERILFNLFVHKRVGRRTRRKASTFVLRGGTSPEQAPLILDPGAEASLVIDIAKLVAGDPTVTKVGIEYLAWNTDGLVWVSPHVDLIVSAGRGIGAVEVPGRGRDEDVIVIG